MYIVLVLSWTLFLVVFFGHMITDRDFDRGWIMWAWFALNMVMTRFQ